MLLRIRYLPLAALSLSLAVLVPLSGCNSSKDEGKNVVDKSSGDQADGKNSSTKKPAPPAKPDPAKLWAAQVAKVEKLIDADQLDAAQGALPEFATLLAATDQKEPNVEQKAAAEALQARISKRRAELAQQERVQLLAAAQEKFAKQEYSAAADDVNRLLAISPTDEQLQQATELRQQIERILSRQRELRGMMRMLASEDKNQVRSAQSQLGKEPEVALSLLLEAVKQVDDPLLVRNALETMRRMKRPDVSLPAMVGVLSRPEQKENWEDAVREISYMKEPGAGEPLLELVLAAKSPEQRSAALRSLVQVVDPPAQTEIALLPWVMQDGPELPLALQAVHLAVRTHGLFDAATARNMEFELTPEQAEQLAALPARLEELMKTTAAGETPSDAAYQAQVLAVATRRQDPQVLADVKLYGFSAETEGGAAAAVLDGVWNSVDLATQWRHPVTERSSLVFDLGTERTVTGIRIWNFNETAGMHRGWKEVIVYVSNNPREVDPITTGVVPMAPGLADTPDYSTVVPVDFARGRYVKILAKSFWRPDTYTGLAEVQIIGF